MDSKRRNLASSPTYCLLEDYIIEFTRCVFPIRILDMDGNNGRYLVLVDQ